MLCRSPDCEPGTTPKITGIKSTPGTKLAVNGLGQMLFYPLSLVRTQRYGSLVYRKASSLVAAFQLLLIELWRIRSFKPKQKLLDIV